LRLANYAVPLQATAQFYFNLFHPSLGTFKPESSPQLFSFTAGKTRADHRHLQ
jgi:hypothetical protein